MLNYSNILGGHHLEPHPRGRTSAAGFEDSTSVHPVGCARKEAEKIGRQSCQESGWSHTCRSYLGLVNTHYLKT